MKVFLLTTGDGTDGYEWEVLGIYSTHSNAADAKATYERPRHRPDGSTFIWTANIEEWPVDATLEK